MVLTVKRTHTLKKVSHKKNWKRLSLLILIGIFIGLLVVVVFERTKATNTLESPGKAPPSSTVKAKDLAKNNGKNKPPNSKGAFLDNQYNQSGSTTPPTESSITIDAKQNGSSVVIIAKLFGLSLSNGVCDLTIRNGDKLASMSAEIIYQAEYSTCAGFSAPISSVGAGRWNISISVKSQSVEKNANVDVEVKSE